MVGVDGKLHKMKCKVCNKIEMHIIKLLSLKLELLWKHASQIKVAIVILNVVVICIGR